MKFVHTPEEEIVRLKYGLQACHKLEQVFVTRNDLDSAAHFRLRQKQIKRELETFTVKPIFTNQ
jgi:hypothetical protein